MHSVRVTQQRPDFRVFIDLLYGHGRNVDTDGDAEPVFSRAWTWLYLKDRESDDPSLTIAAEPEGSPNFTVTSASPPLEELAALYLFLHCGESILAGSKLLDEDDVERLEQRYRVELARAQASAWHQSSPLQPYPVP